MTCERSCTCGQRAAERCNPALEARRQRILAVDFLDGRGTASRGSAPSDDYVTVTFLQRLVSRVRRWWRLVFTEPSARH